MSQNSSSSGTVATEGVVRASEVAEDLLLAAGATYILLAVPRYMFFCLFVHYGSQLASLYSCSRQYGHSLGRYV